MRDLSKKWNKTIPLNKILSEKGLTQHEKLVQALDLMSVVLEQEDTPKELKDLFLETIERFKGLSNQEFDEDQIEEFDFYLGEIYATADFHNIWLGSNF